MGLLDRPPAGGGTAGAAARDRAAGRNPADRTAEQRASTAARNCNRVAGFWGSGRGTSRQGAQ